MDGGIGCVCHCVLYLLSFFFLFSFPSFFFFFFFFFFSLFLFSSSGFQTGALKHLGRLRPTFLCPAGVITSGYALCCRRVYQTSPMIPEVIKTEPIIFSRQLTRLTGRQTGLSQGARDLVKWGWWVDSGKGVEGVGWVSGEGGVVFEVWSRELPVCPSLLPLCSRFLFLREVLVPSP